MSFSKDVKRFSRKAEEKADKVVRMSFIALSTRIIRRSPVGDADQWKPAANGKIYKPKGYTGGRFRANWQASVNKPKLGKIDSDKAPETNAGTATDSVRNAGAVKNARRYYLMNNLPYAKAIEHGHSRQAPFGVVKLAVAEWPSIVSLVNRLVK